MENNKKQITRRGFIGKGALLGAGMGLMSVQGFSSDKQGKILRNNKSDADYQLNDPNNIIYSACLNCNTGCGIKCKIQDGVLSKIDGNPYNPFNLVPHLDMKTNVDDASIVDAGLCPKGQAGIQIAYDPYRIRKVLKRAGKRGENKWISIPFDQAVKEIVDGGNLFSSVPGEKDRYVEGLRSIMAMTDEKIAKEMAADMGHILKEKDKENRQILMDNFKQKFAQYKDKFIDWNHPDLGLKNNQFVMAWGRLKGGRKEFIKYLGGAFGTTNLHGHTTVCQGSLYFTCKAISEQYIDGKFSGSKKFYWQADLEKAKYVLFVGANLFDANYGPTNRTVRLTENLSKGYTKIGVVDPRFTKLASKAEDWLPINPGTDSALAMAIIQWIIANERFNAQFLSNSNLASAKAQGEASYINASWLVEVKDGNPGKFLRASDYAIAGAKTNDLVVMVNGKPTAFDPNDSESPIYGDLFVNSKLKNKKGETVDVKSSLQILKESSEENSIDEWCKIAGVDVAAVIKVANKLTSYGNMACVDVHRGSAQHTNGFYNIFSWMSINMLLGNFDHKGGMALASKFGYDGSKGEPFNIAKPKHKIAAFGISSIRHGVDYENTSIFKGYPAKRNWYPISSDVYEEIIPSIGDQYPYPIKALFTYMGAPTYSLPAGHTNIDVLADLEKLPLYFASDIIVGSTSMYADYIFPDLSYLERWEFQGSHPNMIHKAGPVRQPVISPIPETIKVYNQEMPISLESLLMAIGENMNFKAFGDNAFGAGEHFRCPEDFYLRGVANMAFSNEPSKEVPDADDKELQIFLDSRRHLDKSVFDASKWKQIVGENKWRKVVYVLNRGGRFDDHEKAYEGDLLKNRYGRLLNMYHEKTAGKKYSGTGKKYSGIARYLPISTYDGQSLDSLSKGYPLHLITSRTISQTKSRTVGSYWLNALMPENAIIINNIDAIKLNLKDNDLVKVVSATNTKGQWDLKNGRTKDMIGKIKITETIKPGIINFYLGFGHWATGASDIEVNGEIIKGDPRRAKGIHANAAMWTDPSLRNNTCLVDPVGGSVSFYDTKVKLEKV